MQHMYDCSWESHCGKLQYGARSHPEIVGDISRVTLNFDLSKIPFVHFLPVSRPIFAPKIKRTFAGSYLRAVTDDDADNVGYHSTTTRVKYRQ